MESNNELFSKTELSVAIDNINKEIEDKLKELMDNVNNGKFQDILQEIETLQAQLDLLTKDL